MTGCRAACSKRWDPPLAPRYRRGLLVSRALDPAMRLIATRHSVSTSTVLLAAAAALIGGWSGAECCGIFTMANNRSAAGYADAISKLNQIGLFTVDLAGLGGEGGWPSPLAGPTRAGFDALVPHSWQAALRAYRYAYYNPVVMDRAFLAIGRPPGSALEPHCYFNDLRLPGNTEGPGDVKDPAEIRAALAGTTVTWPESLDRFAWRFRLQILDDPAGIGVSVTADTACLPPERIEDFLREYEQLVVSAAI